MTDAVPNVLDKLIPDDSRITIGYRESVWKEWAGRYLEETFHRNISGKQLKDAIRAEIVGAVARHIETHIHVAPAQ